MAIILIPISGTGVIDYTNEYFHEKKYISTQIDRHVPEKFRMNHENFTKFVKYFLEYLEEYKLITTVSWNSLTTYAKNDSITYNNNSYRSLQDSNLNKQPDLYNSYWELFNNKTIGIYEHLNNLSNYINIDFIDRTDVLYQDLYNEILEEMANTFNFNQRVYADASGYDVQDIIHMIKRFNMSKITNISFQRMVSYLLNNSPSSNIAFGETLAELLVSITYSAGTTYSIGNKVIYNQRSYESLQNSNIGNTPDVSPLWWKDLGDYVVYDPDFNVPMEYDERFRYWVNTDDFKIVRLLNIIHPAGWFREIVYHPILAEIDVFVAMEDSVAAAGIGDASGSFDYSVV